MIQLNGYGYTAQIDPSRGGSCVRLARGGVEALRTPPEKDQQDNDLLYGTPLLFFPNRIDGGRFVFEDRVYQLPVNEASTGCFLHGTLYQTMFEVAEQSETQAVLRYRADAEKPYLTFPHAFTLTLRYSLTEKGLEQETVFTNDSAQNMPVALAFHTTFRVCDVEGDRLRVDADEEYSRDSRYLPDGGRCVDFPARKDMENGTYSLEMKRGHFLRMSSGKRMELLSPRQGAKIVYQAGESYRYWMMVHGEGYVCVEPQSWMINCPNAPFEPEECGMDWIAPAGIKRYTTVLSIEKLNA